MDRDSILKTLGKNIQKHRSKISSQEEFAESIGKDRSYYGKIEQGKINISIVKLAELAKDLKTSTSELVKDIDKE